MQALVIDDSRTTRMILCSMLKPLGFETAQASDGQAGLDSLHAKQGKPELVLVDLNMPGMNGVEFVKAVRQDSGLDQTKVVLVTGESDGLVQQAMDNGASGLLPKPFTLETLATELGRLGLTA